jgi:putative SOS response-associated peptidase YedK
MCSLYSYKKSRDEIRSVIKALIDSAGNLKPMPAIFPDSIAPVVRNTRVGPELIKMRWGFPSPPIYSGRLVTNVRNVTGGYWKPWLKPEQRCLVPATSFCEYADKPDPKTKRKTPTWFALSEERPLFFFAGIWREWTGTRGTKADPVDGKHLVYSFLTTDSNATVKPIHAKAMPVMLTSKEEWEIWLKAPMDEALKLQHPLPDKMLKIVANGEKKD